MLIISDTDYDAVVIKRKLYAHVPAAHIVQHQLRIAVERMTPATTSAGLETDHIAGTHARAIREWRYLDLVCRTTVDEAATRTPSLAAVHAPSRVLDAIDTNGQDRLGPEPR
jgi:hypothetical protein